MLKSMRDKKKLTLEQVAKKIGMHKQQYYNIESGRAPIPAKYAKKLAKTLGCSLADIYEFYIDYCKDKWRSALMIFLMLLGVGCAKSTNQSGGSSHDYLVIGDSISLGHTPFISGAAHTDGNAQSTVVTLSHLNDWLLPAKKVIWNNGIWDIKLANQNQYEENLNSIADILIAEYGAKNIYFVTTTYVPASDPVVDSTLVPIYNDIAKAVMLNKGIAVIDITAYSEELANQGYQNANDVHFNSEGYALLANFIIDFIQ